MKKLIVLLLFIIAAGSYAQVKVAFVDSEIIIAQLPEAKIVKDKLEAEQKLYLDTLTAYENEIKNKAEVLKTKYETAQNDIKAGKLTEDQIKSLEAELGQMQEDVNRMDQEYGLYKQNVNKILVDLQDELFKPVREKITKSIEALAKELKYNIVLDKAAGGLIYGDKEIDITFKVLDKLK